MSDIVCIELVSRTDWANLCPCELGHRNGLASASANVTAQCRGQSGGGHALGAVHFLVRFEPLRDHSNSTCVFTCKCSRQHQLNTRAHKTNTDRCIAIDDWHMATHIFSCLAGTFLTAPDSGCPNSAPFLCCARQCRFLCGATRTLVTLLQTLSIVTALLVSIQSIESIRQCQNGCPPAHH